MLYTKTWAYDVNIWPYTTNPIEILLMLPARNLLGCIGWFGEAGKGIYTGPHVSTRFRWGVVPIAEKLNPSLMFFRRWINISNMGCCWAYWNNLPRTCSCSKRIYMNFMLFVINSNLHNFCWCCIQLDPWIMNDMCFTQLWYVPCVHCHLLHAKILCQTCLQLFAIQTAGHLRYCFVWVRWMESIDQHMVTLDIKCEVYLISPFNHPCLIHWLICRRWCH